MPHMPPRLPHTQRDLSERRAVRADQPLRFAFPAEFARGASALTAAAIALRIDRRDRDPQIVFPYQSRYLGQVGRTECEPGHHILEKLFRQRERVMQKMPGIAKKPTSNGATSRTNAVIGTGGASWTRCPSPRRAIRSRRAGLNAGFSGPRIVKVNSGRHKGTLSMVASIPRFGTAMPW